VTGVQTCALPISDEAKEYFGNRVYRTAIPRNVRLAEAPSFGKPIVLYDIQSVGAQSYLALAREVMARAARPAGGAGEPDAGAGWEQGAAAPPSEPAVAES